MPWYNVEIEIPCNMGISISTLKQNVRETQILKLTIKDTLRYALCAEGTTFTAM